MSMMMMMMMKQSTTQYNRLNISANIKSQNLKAAPMGKYYNIIMHYLLSKPKYVTILQLIVCICQSRLYESMTSFMKLKEHIRYCMVVKKQEAQLSPSDRAMRLVSSNLANYHTTVQKQLIRQVLAKLMV